MRSLQSGLLLLSVPVALAYKPCPLLGPVFPVPTSLCDGPTFQEALQNLKSTLDNATATGTTQYGTWPPASNSFSLGIFDTTSPGQLFSYEYTSPQTKNGTKGVKEVTADSIYRLGSLSKLITAYLFLIEVGPSYWSHLVTEFVPQLAEAAAKCSALTDPVDCIDWDDVTLGALASHMAGIPRDYSTPAELLDPLLVGAKQAVKYGLPPLPESALPPCGLSGTDACTESEYLNGVTSEHPVFAPFTSPSYSNAGYEILAFALEKITGKAFPDMLEKDIFAKLNMTRSSYYNPNSMDNSVITDHEPWIYYAELGDETPDGGMFSTQSDLARLGQSILASTLLKPSVTRQWMKPVTFTSDVVSNVGMPWEILRATNVTDHVFDLYTKSGGLYAYSSYLILSPDYNVGFVVLVAGNDNAAVIEQIADTVVAAVFPALENTAREQAQEKYAGTYNSTEEGVESSIILATQAGEPGLKVEQWISNGTNMAIPLAALYGGGSEVDIRLYPERLVQQTSGGGERVAFRAVIEPLDSVPDGGLFSGYCGTWFDVDQYVYGNVGLDEFLFQIDDGKVVGISPRAFRIMLKKTE